MANPNIVEVTSIYGDTEVINATTANANVVQNAVSSGEVYKINSLFASNINPTDVMGISVDLIRNSNAFSIARNVAVPYNSTMVVISKESAIYLREGDALQINASSDANVQVICSYEVIS
jgi:hypothetical protein